MTSLPSGLASISSQFDDAPNVRGAVAFGRMAAKRREMDETAVMDWRPIETAPIGVPALYAVHCEQCFVMLKAIDGAFVHYPVSSDGKGKRIALSAPPTHWMPLPKHPDTLGSAIDRHAALAVSAGYRSADRR